MDIKLREKNEYMERLSRKMFSRIAPISGQIDITHRCNLSCRHCYIVPNDKRELSFEEVVPIIDKIYNAGVLALCFSGGEPLLREDFLDIYAYARKKGFLVTIFTNGTLMTSRMIDYFTKMPPYSIEITLNGISKKGYEKITSVPGSFEKVMQTIHWIKERNLPLVLKCNGMTTNRDEILKIKNFTETLLGKNHFRCDFMLYPGKDGSKKPCHLRLTAEEIFKIVYADRDMRLFAQKEFCYQQEYAQIEKNNLFPCTLTSFYIDPYGKMRLCPFLEQMRVDLKKKGFLQGFRALYAALSALEYSPDSKCRSCKIRYLCRQCPGRALIENGDIQTPIEYFCKFTHKLEETRIEVTKDR